MSASPSLVVGGPPGRSPAGAAWANPVFTLLVAAVVIGLVDAIAVPVLVREQATDWRAYEEAARLLAAHTSPYAWTIDADVRAITDYPYLYPPPLAAIWGLGLDATLFAVLKIVSVGTMAGFVAVARPAGPLRAALAAAAIVGLTVASPPVIHDLILGNVMTLYLAATALALAIPSRWAAIPLGVVVAVALKPAIAPVLLWLLIRRRSQFAAAFVAGLATTAVFALAVGPGAYIDYLAALPKLGGLAQPFSGNLGLSSISIVLAVVAIPLALGWVIWAARDLDPWAGAAVAVAMTLLAQPTLGLNYAALLAPGVVALWFVDRRASFAMAVALPLVALVSPPLAGVVLGAVATVAGLGERRGAAAAPIAGPGDRATVR